MARNSRQPKDQRQPALCRAGQASPRRRTSAALAMVVSYLASTGKQHHVTSQEISEEITVVTPSGPIEAGEDFTVEWAYSASGGTTGDLNRFSIGLRSCGDDGSACSGASACGDDYEELCTDEEGCMDSDGSYDVQIIQNAPAGKYGIKVALTQDTTVFACSEAFSVTAPADDVVADGEASLEVIVPSYVLAGTAFTAQWDYNDGAGGSGGTFEVNLYSCADGACDDEACGTFAEALCEDPGCYDPGIGDYDVVVSATQAAGDYKLQVKSDGGTSDCTASSFEVVEEGGIIPTPVPTEMPTPAPTAPAAPAVTTSSSSSDSAGTPGSPGTPPSPVPPMVACDSSAELEFVYTKETTKLPLITVAHASGDKTEVGCLTLTKLYEWLATAPSTVLDGLLYTVDPTTGVADTDITATPTGTWLLSTSVVVTNGVTFQIKGTSVSGGDCDELKLSSTVKRWFRIMGYGGNLDIEETLIQSWDATKSLQHIFKASTDGTAARSFISCVSEVTDADETCSGVAQKDMGECRMDIVNSELGYLGYDSTESYGVTWKVRGLCDDQSNAETLFDNVRVYGDMSGSNIHHMWYGMYSYGHLGGVWSNNEMHDNHVYGFDPHDDSDYLTIEGNTVYNNGNHGIIASKRCDHLLIKDNVCYDNLGSGIMLHKSCDDSIVKGNECTDNHDAGLSLVETSRCSVTGNTFGTNRWGFRVTLGSTDNVFERNTLNENSFSDIYAYLGSSDEVAEVSPFTGINVNNKFSNNVVNHVSTTVVDIEDSDGTEISSNTFNGGKGWFVFLRSTDTRVVNNTGDVDDPTSDSVTDSCFTSDSGRTPLC